MVLAVLGCFGALWYFDQPGYNAKHRMGTLLTTGVLMWGLTKRFFMGFRDDD